jgi:hypothetical protein
MVTEACKRHIGLEDDYDSDSEEIASSLTWEHEVRDRTFIMIYFLFF